MLRNYSVYFKEHILVQLGWGLGYRSSISAGFSFQKCLVASTLYRVQ